MKFILGRKVGMTQVLQDDGQAVPVTVIAAGPCEVTQLRDIEKDGYSAVQLGYEKISKKTVKKAKKTDKSDKREKKTAQPQFKIKQEFRIDEPEVKVGDAVSVEIFEAGDRVKISGTSKGRGFQGPVKRHNFAGGPASHGHRHVLRQQGSIGQRFPQHTLRGKKMAGQMGNKKSTVRKVEVVSIDKDNNALFIKGAVPGARGGILRIESMKY
ncbi:50S ribosomal protein L3 [Patescibacteria group bacterium]